MWEGICHGWAPASVYEPAPRRSVSLYASDGKTIVTFYPDDIKAIASQFYASSIKNYKTDIMGDNGTSYNNNAASFYLAVTNLIGRRHTPMIYDASIGGAIWNYPAYSYTNTYYNVATNTNSGSNINNSLLTISQAKISSTYNARVSASNASRGTVYLLGVKMSLTFSNEIQPNRGTPSPNASLTKSYNFILDLDSNYNIIGETWVNTDRPDFIWKINEGYGIKKDVNDNINGFSGSSSELRLMTATAKRLSTRSMPIYAVMKYLINNSS